MKIKATLPNGTVKILSNVDQRTFKNMDVYKQRGKVVSFLVVDEKAEMEEQIKKNIVPMDFHGQPICWLGHVTNSFWFTGGVKEKSEGETTVQEPVIEEVV